MKLSCFFMGTPDIAVPALRALFQDPHIDLKLVISQPDKPQGRKLKLSSPAVAQFAKENNIPLLQTSRVNDDLPLEETVDFILVFAFAQFLSEKVLNSPRIGCFNIHTSLLPRYRGASPIQHALLNGDKETGVCIQKMVKKMDAGNIILERKVAISDSDRADTLYSRLTEEAAKAMPQFIQKLQGSPLPEESQDEALVSFAPVLSKQDGHLRFTEETAQETMNRFRAMTPWPSAHFFLDGKRVKILEVEYDLKKVPPSQLDIRDGVLLIGCKEGSVRIKKLQVEGKKPWTDQEFLNGYRGDLKIT